MKAISNFIHAAKSKPDFNYVLSRYVRNLYKVRYLAIAIVWLHLLSCKYFPSVTRYPNKPKSAMVSPNFSQQILFALSSCFLRTISTEFLKGMREYVEIYGLHQCFLSAAPLYQIIIKMHTNISPTDNAFFFQQKAVTFFREKTLWLRSPSCNKWPLCAVTCFV